MLNRAFLILWFFFSFISPHLISTMRESDYTSMKGSKLVKLLTSQDLEIRGMAFYELQRRQCPARGSYAEFKENYKIFKVIVCPTGPDKPPIYLVLYDYDYRSSFPDQYYSIPDPEIFEKDQDKTGLVWKSNIGITIYDSTGGRVEIPCEGAGFYHSIIADINGDGFIELVDARRSRNIEKDASPRATVLKVWVLKEIPRCIFALMYNLENRDWACALEDKNNDGIYDILLGPGKPGKVTPVAAYKWDAGRGIYHGPRGGEENQFRILDAAKLEEELKKAREPSFITFPEQPAQKQKLKNYNKPYQYVSLKNLSDREILEYMKEGNRLHSL